MPPAAPREGALESGTVSPALAVVALALLEAGFWMEALRGDAATRWVNALVGVMMVLIVLAQSRISMRLLHGMLGHLGVHEADYRAPPPRRRLAIWCIALATTAELAGVAPSTTGWLALAAAAALLNLLNDWHVGRALLSRYPLVLYGSYWLAALGYAGLGVGALGAPWPPSAPRHLLMVGTMGLSVFSVMAIAGRLHTGNWLDRRHWLPLAALLIVLAALVRALAGVAGAQVLHALWLSGMLWVLAFTLYLLHAWRALAGPRTDGGHGCDEPKSAADSPSVGCG